MKLLQSLLIAISMYSKIPVPGVKWSADNMKYVMCFFPVVGVITAFAVRAAGTLLDRSGCGRLLFAAVMTLIPVLINGGIHMDGFMDTVDALCSYGDREKKLKILQDPHAGAFAMFWLSCYFVISLGLWSEVTAGMYCVLGWGYVLSRSLSGLAVVVFPAAKRDGLARTFQDGADKRRCTVIMSGWSLAAAIGMLLASVPLGVAALLAAGLAFLYYRMVLIRQFGGITGDLAGFFLQLCELGMLAGVVITGGVLWNRG